jgi:hypothetical protein
MFRTLSRRAASTGSRLSIIAACDRLSGLAAAASRLPTQKINIWTNKCPHGSKLTLQKHWQRHCGAAPIASEPTDKPARRRRAAKRPWMRIAGAGSSETGSGQCWSSKTWHGTATVQEKESSSRRSTHSKIGRISRVEVARVFAEKKFGEARNRSRDDRHLRNGALQVDQIM